MNSRAELEAAGRILHDGLERFEDCAAVVNGIAQRLTLAAVEARDVDAAAAVVLTLTALLAEALAGDLAVLAIGAELGRINARIEALTAAVDALDPQA